LNNLPFEALVIPLAVVMDEIFVHDSLQMRFAEKITRSAASRLNDPWKRSKCALQFGALGGVLTDRIPDCSSNRRNSG
jgi:hypothetical protein